MKTKLIEWYRIAEPVPSDETIEKRKPAIDSLIAHLQLPTSSGLLAACIAAVVRGFELGNQKEDELAAFLIGTIRQTQPAFPGERTQNELHLRATCAVALGEIISLESSSDSADAARLAASWYISAVGIRPEPSEPHLKSILKDILNASVVTLESQARLERSRRPLDLTAISEVETTELAAFWEQLEPLLTDAFTQLDNQANADREELEVLWWHYNGRSESERRPLLELSPGIIAMCCGIEVADKIKPPAPERLRQLIVQAVSAASGATEVSNLSLVDAVGQWQEQHIRQLHPTDSKVAGAAREFPVLLPLTWLCTRLRESRGASGWPQEFELRTGLPTTTNYALPQIALQIFNERLAQKTFQDYE